MIIINDVIKTILKRRSYRLYSNKKVKPKELDLILTSAIYAPSATNAQNWHFTVIQNKEIINYLSNKTKGIMKTSNNDYFVKKANNPNYHLFHNANIIILVSGDKKEFSVDNLALASQNIMLAAESLDIGSCYIGLIKYFFDTKEGKEYIKQLNIPNGYYPHHAITLGYKVKVIDTPLPRKENCINYIS